MCKYYFSNDGSSRQNEKMENTFPGRERSKHRHNPKTLSHKFDMKKSANSDFPILQPRKKYMHTCHEIPILRNTLDKKNCPNCAQQNYLELIRFENPRIDVGDDDRGRQIVVVDELLVRFGAEFPSAVPFRATVELLQVRVNVGQSVLLVDDHVGRFLVLVHVVREFVLILSPEISTSRANFPWQRRSFFAPLFLSTTESTNSSCFSARQLTTFTRAFISFAFFLGISRLACLT